MVRDDNSHLKQRIRELEASLSEARAACAAKDVFLSSMGHEMRTPMNAMMGFSQLLLRDARSLLPIQQQRQIQAILRAGEHMVRLLDDISSFASGDGASPSLELAAVELGPVVEEVAAILQAGAGREGVHVEATSPPPGTPAARVDRRRLMQILLNLGSNAVKYNRPGGSVMLGVSAVSTNRIRVSVIDTGSGIPSDQQGSLFRPFQRAGQERGLIPGTGLGLALARRLAEQMGGTVAFCSRVGIGSTFWVDLDVAEAASRERSLEESASLAAPNEAS